MRRILLFITVVLAFPAAAQASYSGTVLADSPSGYWRLGESSGTSAADAAGSYGGTYAGGFTLGATGALSGDPDTAVVLNGTSGRVSIPSTFPTLSGSAMTAEAWVKLGSTSQVGQMIFGAYNVTGSNQGWGFIYNQGSADNKLAFLDTTSVVWRKSTGTITDTAWHYVAVTVTAGGTTTFYIDGAAAGSVAGHAPNSYTGTKSIGSATNNISAFYNGTIDEVAVYASALSSTQIAAHYAAGSSAGPKTYYVSAAGSDSNNGTSTATPWASISKVNSTTLNPGDTVNFRGGDTFTGQINPTTNGTSADRITYESYGTGRATIANTGAGHGIWIGAYGGFIVQDLNFSGPGVGTSSGTGILLYQSSGSKVTIPTTIRRVNSTGWRYGLTIGGDTKGYDSVTVDEAELYGNRDWGYQAFGPVFTGANYINSNLTVRRTNAYDNLGDPLHAVTATGNGIIMGSVDGALVETSSAYNNGVNNTTSAGPVGIWLYDANDVTIRRSVSYSNKTSGANDGGGFDIDQNVTNSLLEDDLAYDNDGYGFVACPCDGDYPWNNNTIRGVSSVANDKDNSAGGEMLIASPSPLRSTVGSGLLIENSTFLAKDQGTVHPDVVGVGTVGGATFSGSPASVVNNMFVQTGTGSLVEAASNYSTSSILFSSNGYRRHSSFEVKWPTATTYTSKLAWSTATGQEP